MSVATVSSQIRVGVIGANGRMGEESCAAIQDAEDLSLVARVGRQDSLAELVDHGAEVAVDFTHPDSVMRNVEFCMDAGIHAVVGTTGIDENRLTALRRRLGPEPASGVIIAPNFSIGALLLMRFCEAAARHYESVEVIDSHHPAKVDAPSGTATRAAELIARAREAAGVGSAPDGTKVALPGARGALVEGVPVHSLRMQGIVGRTEVVFGTQGETLTVSHDSLERSSFMPGVLAAVRAIPDRPGLTLDLDFLLDLP